MSNQTFSLVFTKKFTSGILTGLTSSPQFLNFPTLESRQNWLKGVRANQDKKAINWVFSGETLFYTDFSREEAIADYQLWAM